MKRKDGDDGKEDNDGNNRDVHPDDRERVGYKKPPKHGRFKPGQSGNPKGRPKGARNRTFARAERSLRTLLLEEANRQHIVHDSKGRKSTLSTSELVLRSLVRDAVNGNQRARRLYLELTRDAQHGEREEFMTLFEKFAEYKRSAPRGRPWSRGPAALPHPDHVILDPVEGEIRIAGPLTPEEVPIWDRWGALQKMVESELKVIAQHGRLCHADENDPAWAQLLTQRAKEVLGTIGDALGGDRATMAFLQRLDHSAALDSVKPIRRLPKKPRDWAFIIILELINRELVRTASPELKAAMRRRMRRRPH